MEEPSRVKVLRTYVVVRTENLGSLQLNTAVRTQGYMHGTSYNMKLGNEPDNPRSSTSLITSTTGRYCLHPNFDFSLVGVDGILQEREGVLQLRAEQIRDIRKGMIVFQDNNYGDLIDEMHREEMNFEQRVKMRSQVVKGR